MKLRQVNFSRWNFLRCFWGYFGNSSSFCAETMRLLENKQETKIKIGFILNHTNPLLGQKVKQVKTVSDKKFKNEYKEKLRCDHITPMGCSTPLPPIRHRPAQTARYENRIINSQIIFS